MEGRHISAWSGLARIKPKPCALTLTVHVLFLPGYCTVPSFFRHGARSTFRGRTRRSRFWEMKSRDTGARRRLNGRWQLRPIRSALGRWQPLKSLLKGVQDCLLFGEPFGPSSSFRVQTATKACIETSRWDARMFHRK